MIQEIQITCTPDDWMASTVQAVGVPGIAPCYTHIVGHELPAQQRVQLLTIIDHIRAMGADRWIASCVYCSRRHAGTYAILRDDGSEDTITLTDAVVISLEVRVGWGTDRISHDLTDAESIALYDTLVSSDFWLSYLDNSVAAPQ